MNVKNILSAIAFLAVVTSPVTALAVEPTGHDHSATKGATPSSSGSTVKKADKECNPTQAQGAGDDQAKPSQESTAKCVPEHKKNENEKRLTTDIHIYIKCNNRTEPPRQSRPARPWSQAH